MSPTPVTFASPTAPASYAWEATDEEVAERYGLPVSQVARFDLNTSPFAHPAALRAIAAGRYDRPVNEYPPSDYRRLVRRAADTFGVAPDEILVGAGADEVLDLIAKAFLAPGRAAVVPVPTYAMFRVVTEQRGARAVLVPRRGPESGWAFEPDAVRTAACDADLVWLCSPNNPTGLPEPEGAIEDLLGALEADAAAAGRPAPVVVVDEAYAEFTGRTLLPARSRYPRLVVVRTMSKAYGLAGLRVGFALARPEVIALIAPYRPPGSVSVVSVAAAAEALAEPGWVAENVARVASERERLATVFAAAGWPADPSVTNFLLVRFGTPERTARIAEALLRRGLVPRTFPAGHPLAAALRITVRSAAENDRLAEAIEALAEVTDDGATEGTVRAATVPPAGADARAAVRPAPAVETEEADR